MRIMRVAMGQKSGSTYYLLWAILFALLTACSAGDDSVPAVAEEVSMSMELTSPSFKNGEAIPRKYSCDGQDISPPLRWKNLPDGAASLALIMDDPDAPGRTWVHWVLLNLPASMNELPENITSEPELPGGGSQGNNSWNRTGYGGPCPPGGTHRYFFKLYALDTQLELSAGATKEEALKAMEGHILAQGEIMGTYTRQ